MSRRQTLIAGITAAFAGIVVGIGLVSILTGSEQRRSTRRAPESRSHAGATAKRELARKSGKSTRPGHNLHGKRAKARSGSSNGGGSSGGGSSEGNSEYDCEYCGEDDSYDDSERYDSSGQNSGSGSGSDVSTPGPAAAPAPDVSPAPPPAPAPPPDVIPTG